MTAAPGPLEKRHLDRIGRMPCLVCHAPAIIHHVVSDGYQRITRTHRLIMPLCPECHTDGRQAIHRVGHRRFGEIHDLNPIEWASAEWERTYQEFFHG